MPGGPAALRPQFRPVNRIGWIRGDRPDPMGSLGSYADLRGRPANRISCHRITPEVDEKAGARSHFREIRGSAGYSCAAKSSKERVMKSRLS